MIFSGKRSSITILFCFLVPLLAASCAGFGSTVTDSTAKSGGSINRKSDLPEYVGIKKMITVAKFTSSEADYQKGLSYANAAYDTLVNRLQGSGRFIIIEDRDFSEVQRIQREAGAEQTKRTLAQYIVTGTVNQVASKTTSSGGKIFGIGASTNNTTTEASVTIRLIDTTTGQVVFAEEGQGSSSNTSRNTSVLGVSVSGGGYDRSSLESNAIYQAIDSLITNIILACDKDPWKSEIFASEGQVFIVGGASQGINAGKVLKVYTHGAKVTNPQTGSIMELPGREVASAAVVQTFGARIPQDEVSLISISGNAVNMDELDKYYVTE